MTTSSKLEKQEPSNQKSTKIPTPQTAIRATSPEKTNKKPNSKPLASPQSQPIILAEMRSET